MDPPLELPEEERATLAGWLIESLKAEEPDGVETAWRLEIEQRINELEAGETDAVKVPAVGLQRQKPGY